MVFDNFTLRECSISTNEETNFFNLKDLIQNQGEDLEIGTAFAIDKELGFIAVSNEIGLHIFDYQDNFNKITEIWMSNIVSVTFCNYNIVIMASDSVDTVISTY